MHGASKEGVLPNVIKYYASLMEGPKVWIIMELAEGGSIRTLVRANHDPDFRAQASCCKLSGN